MGRRSIQPSRLLALATTLGLIVLSAWVVFSDNYRIHGARVSGNVRISAPAVYAASGLEGASIFTVDVAEAERRVLALDGVRAADVRTGLPARAAIAIEETRPVLLWQTDGLALAVDELGLAVPPPATSEGLVLVHDPSRRLTAPGERIPPQEVAAALAFSARFGPLTWQPEAGFTATTPEGWELRLGRDGRLAATQADLLAAVRRDLQGRSGSVAFVDLRFVNRPYYRLRGGSE